MSTETSEAGEAVARPPLSCICLTGPTACGKTELALRLADAFPVEIVSMDSAMVYRGMDIGTAKPSPEILAAYPHHLVDILDPSEVYSAGRFSDDATQAVRAIRERGRLPLLVGGTLLYLRAFRDGLADLPKRDPELRRRLDAEAEEIGWNGMHERLQTLDPEAAARIEPGDRQRIQRALEVCLLSGRPLSRLHSEQATGRAVDVASIGIVPGDRERLAGRIQRRLAAMVQTGFIEEVQALRCRPELNAAMPSMRSVGYRQVWAHLDGHYDWAEAERRILAATRQFAKRQMTWLRSDAQIEVFDAFSEGLFERIVATLRPHLPAE